MAQWFLNLCALQSHLEGLLNHKFLDSPMKALFQKVGWGLGICVSNKFSGDGDAAGTETSLL